MAVPTLTDGVVTLRAHHEDDVPGVLEQSVDPLSRQWTRVPIPYELEDARRFVRQAMPDGWASDQEWGFAVEAVGPAGVPAYAGTVSLRNNGPGRAEIAYGAHPRARGTGAVDRALRLLLDWGFAERGLGTVIWWAQVGNWASRKAAWRLGFSCDGVVRGWHDHRDGLVDSWVGTLRAEDPRTPRQDWWVAPTIRGERVVLRQLRETDTGRLVEAYSDPVSTYWFSRVPMPFTDADAAAFLLSRGELLATASAMPWAVADPATDELLGMVSVKDLDQLAGPEIGYWTHPAARGRGVAAEAVRLAVRHSFIDAEDGGLGLTKLRLVAAVDNTASRKVAVANRFREAGIERAGTPCRDGAHDAVVYDLLASDLRG
ncbi:N-acetyltransferase [Nocardioides marmoriginsengisoli]|uniref:N-acetyltransferase n=1 Tax=Nocardioides marmoriginsengisoli TaxID=661483 RepID=A0A3N0CIX0_9ACTN|nr:GNAT family N-acetyltransferase [Nocardioides marmoriginsengisoli]RNL62956.1 N-acetyltransferase [Nocardioides marmoriginsengisoli]